MSTKEIELIDEEKVSQYLKDHPDFFHDKEYLIPDLNLPHERGGTISIVERQMVLLREANQNLQEKINNYVANAQNNDTLFEKIRLIILELLHCSSVSELNTIIEKKLGGDFDASACKLVFIGDQAPDQLPSDSTKKVLGELFARKRTVCGPFNDAQATLFFPKEKKRIISAAVIPIHLNSPVVLKSLGIPLLIIGSEKPDHFNKSQDTLFLDFIGEVLAASMLILTK